MDGTEGSDQGNGNGSTSGSEHFNFTMPTIVARKEGDQEVLDTINMIKELEDVEEIVATMKMMISMDILFSASPIVLYYLHKLLLHERYIFRPTDSTFIKDIFVDGFYSKEAEAVASTGKTDEEIEKAQKELESSNTTDNSGIESSLPLSKDEERRPGTNFDMPEHRKHRGKVGQPNTMYDGQVITPIAGHFSRAIVYPLPEHNPKGVHGRIGDLVKYYSGPNTRYSGRPSANQSLAMHHATYYNQARLCTLTSKQALQSLICMMEPDSLASHFYHSEILDKVKSLEEAFDKLYIWDRHHTTLEGTLRKWRSLRVTQFKTAENTWSIAVERLYERATMMQGQLDVIHKHPFHLIEVLQDAIRDQPFYMFVERASTAESPQQYFHKCLDAIAKQQDMENIAMRQQSLPQYRMSGLLTQGDHQASTPTATHTSSKTQPAFVATAHTGTQGTKATTAQPLRAAFYSQAGRRYGNTNQGRAPRSSGKNPIGKDGKRMLCRGCRSDEHFIAKCTAANKAKMISFVEEHVGSDALQLPFDHILDTVQDIPDPIWNDHFNNDASTSSDPKTEHDAKQVMFSDVKRDDGTNLKEVWYSRLSDAATQHALIGMKSLTKVLLESDLTPPKVDDDDTLRLSHDDSQPSLLSTTTNHVQPQAKQRQPKSVCLSKFAPSTKKDAFEGIMLDNGAEGTPSGLPAYLRYCDFANLRPSNTRFVGLGDGVMPSLGVATVRMPLGHDRYLDFETDVVKQDIPLMFGLDQHKEHGSSSDEYHNTFTHHPSGTTIPVTYKMGHMFIEWPVSEVLFSKSDLKKLHDRFGHPTSQALINLLQRTRPEDCDEETKKSIKEITARCKECQTSAPKPTTFRVSMPQDDIVFNHEILKSILRKDIPVQLMTDSKSLFDTITKLSTVSEKRLLIDIAAIRETYRNGELSNVAHVASEYNLADCFTKRTKSNLLRHLMETGKLDHPINQWIINH